MNNSHNTGVLGVLSPVGEVQEMKHRCESISQAMFHVPNAPETKLKCSISSGCIRQGSKLNMAMLAG